MVTRGDVMESPSPPACVWQDEGPSWCPPDPHTPDFVAGKMGKLFPAPLGFAVFWFCGNVWGELVKGGVTKRQ